MSDLDQIPTPEDNAKKPAGFFKRLYQSKKTPQTYRPEHFRRQGKVWLVASVVVLLAWFVLWLFAKSPAVPNADKEEVVQNGLDVRDLPAKIDSMNETKSLVSPINFDEVIHDLRSYPPEFKGKSYFAQNKNKWSVHVMDVAEHEVIVNYLTRRSDRDKFAYFRYTNESGQTRYVLTYGVMNFEQALGATRVMDFELPSSVRIFPEQMKRYFDMIDNYERSNEAAELGGMTSVNLQATTQRLPPEPAKPAPAAPKADEEEDKVETEESEGPAQTQGDQREKEGLAMAPTAVPVETPPAQQNRPRNESPKAEDENKNDIPVTQAVPQKPAERSQPAPAPTEQIQSVQQEETY